MFQDTQQVPHLSCENNVEKIPGVVLFLSETIPNLKLVPSICKASLAKDPRTRPEQSKPNETGTAEHERLSSDGKTEPVSRNDPPCKIHGSSSVAVD